MTANIRIMVAVQQLQRFFGPAQFKYFHATMCDMGCLVASGAKFYLVWCGISKWHAPDESRSAYTAAAVCFK
jgi:hypothetical protein